MSTIPCRCATSRSHPTEGWSEPTAGLSIPITRILSCCGSGTARAESLFRCSAQRGSDLATAAVVDHRLLQRRLAVEQAAVDRARGGDDLAASAEQLVAEFEHPQIGPGARTDARD